MDSKPKVLVGPGSGIPTAELVKALAANGFDARHGYLGDEEILPRQPTRKSQRTPEEVDELKAAAQAKRERKAAKRRRTQ